MGLSPRPAYLPIPSGSVTELQRDASTHTGRVTGGARVCGASSRHPTSAPFERRNHAISHHPFLHLLRCAVHGELASEPLFGAMEDLHGGGQLLLLRMG